MSKRFIVLGAGVSAQILYWQIQETYPGAEVVFVEDVTDIAEVTVEDGNVIHVVKDWDFTHLESGDWTNQGGCEGFLVGSDNPKLKKVLVEKALAHGLRPAPTLIHPRAYVASYGCTIGRGGMIMPGCVIAINARLGDYVYCIVNSTIAHHVTVGDYCTVAPGVAVGSRARIGRGGWSSASVQPLSTTSLSLPACLLARRHVSPRISRNPNIIVAGVRPRTELDGRETFSGQA